MWMLLTGLALVLLLINLWRRDLLIGICAFLLWIGLAVYMFLDTASLFGLDETYYIYFAYVYVVLAISSLLTLMNQQITKEKNGQRWTEWGSRPENKETSYDRYKAELHRRTRRNR